MSDKAYSGYIDLNYKPTKNDLVCDFYLEPEKGISHKKAAEYTAAESSTGTWTEIHTREPYMKKLSAKVFHVKGTDVKIAYPQELFELGNMPQILSSIAGNIFGMKAVKNLRLEDIRFTKKIIKSFPGPKYGIQGVRKILRVKDRPLVGTIVKPKLGLRTKDHAKVAYEAWRGGCDVVKDDENLSSQKFNPFERRVKQTLKMRDRAEKETGEKKVYMPNVTAETQEMLKRAKFVKKNGGRYVMIDIITCGWSAVQSLRDLDLDVVIHAHRAMHGAFTRKKKHGMTMLSVAKIARLIGVDQLHIGTAVGKMEGGPKEVEEIEHEIEDSFIQGNKTDVLSQNWYGKKPVFAVCSGGLQPGHIPRLVEMLGKDIIIQAGGGIHGHPEGTRKGATAMRQAVDAVLGDKSLKEYSKSHRELAQALKMWGKK